MYLDVIRRCTGQCTNAPTGLTSTGRILHTLSYVVCLSRPAPPRAPGPPGSGRRRGKARRYRRGACGLLHKAAAATAQRPWPGAWRRVVGRGGAIQTIQTSPHVGPRTTIRCSDNAHAVALGPRSTAPRLAPPIQMRRQCSVMALTIQAERNRCLGPDHPVLFPGGLIPVLTGEGVPGRCRLESPVQLIQEPNCRQSALVCTR